nr:MAG TPA: hypothetical protein [Caudoviricetes sp.]
MCLICEFPFCVALNMIVLYFLFVVVLPLLLKNCPYSLR